jgi:hypothetical protein
MALPSTGTAGPQLSEAARAAAAVIAATATAAKNAPRIRTCAELDR